VKKKCQILTEKLRMSTFLLTGDVSYIMYMAVFSVPDEDWIRIRLGLWIRIWIGNPVRIEESKNVPPKMKEYHVLKCWMLSLERAGCFSCSLKVLNGSLRNKYTAVFEPYI
jgi:hypothetical protein